MDELPNKTLLRPDEVAEILRITKRQVYNLLKKGAIPSIKIGKFIRVRRAYFAALIEEKNGKTTL
jgi:excisionase family DNA binding protein